jgi:DnaK suppressor protein
MASPKKKSAPKTSAKSKSTGGKKAGTAKPRAGKAAAKAAVRSAHGKASTSKKASTTTTKAAAARKMNSSGKTATAKKTKPAAKPAKPRTAAAKHVTAKLKSPPSAGKSGKSAGKAPKPAVSGLLIVGGIEPYKEKAGEQYMNESQVAHFRKILGTWRQELMEEVDRTVHNMQKEAANFPDPNDRATQESEFTMELRARDRERKLIKKIDESLSALESGDYGYCESCGVEIGIRRLEARPTATLCIDCKTLDEIRERRIGE